MPKKKRKYIYINAIPVGWDIFQTQVLDWLHLYKKHQVDFDLVHTFHVKELKKISEIKNQLTELRKNTTLFTGYIFWLPSRSILFVINALAILRRIFRYAFQYSEVLIFSRGLIGKEIAFLQKIFPVKIIFYFDARGAGGEENKFNAEKDHNYSLKRYKIIADTYYLEYKTLLAADKVFVVSKVLERYYKHKYNMHNKKYVLYPCLSDSEKFYYNSNLRNEVRDKLQINDDIKVFIYSGGIGAWHISEKLFSFFVQLLKHKSNSLMLFLTKDRVGIEKTISEFPEIKNKYLVFSVPNKEVFKYLNAADYGFLFRENTILNNVSSPTKFAEYILCGLPVLISEGIGDYSDYTLKYNLGVLINDNLLKNPEKFDFISFLEKSFDRTYIADIGRRNFSKDSIINRIINELKS